MDIEKLLDDLKRDRDRVDETIVALKRLSANTTKHRGRPPAWLVAAVPKRRGRPPGSKNKNPNA